jgi:hypothetical protein
MENEKSLMINDINNLTIGGNAKVDTFTTLQDKKQIFNLDSKVDFKINDCVGQTIEVHNVLIKNIAKKMRKPEVDENGEIVKDIENKRICILIDDEGKSYVTGSSSFTIQFIKYIQLFGLEEIESENGLLIRIVNKEVKNSNNKALGFELV